VDKINGWFIGHLGTLVGSNPLFNGECLILDKHPNLNMLAQ